MGAGELGEAGHELSVTLAQFVAAPVSALSPLSNTVRSSTVTLPLVRDEVREVVLQEHAGGRGVTPVVHLAAPVNSIDCVARAQKSTVAAVAFVY